MCLRIKRENSICIDAVFINNKQFMVKTGRVNDGCKLVNRKSCQVKTKTLWEMMDGGRGTDYEGTEIFTVNF
jgi:hypothetical protein